MLCLGYVTLDNSGGDIDGHLGHLVLDLVHHTLFLELDLLLRALKHTLGLLICLAEDLLLAKLGATDSRLDDLLALLLGVAHSLLVVCLESLGVGAGFLGVAVHIVDLLLARVYHILERNECDLLKNEVEYEKVRPCKEHSPEVNTDKIFKFF